MIVINLRQAELEIPFSRFLADPSFTLNGPANLRDLPLKFCAKSARFSETMQASRHAPDSTQIRIRRTPAGMEQPGGEGSRSVDCRKQPAGRDAGTGANQLIWSSRLPPSLKLRRDVAAGTETMVLTTNEEPMGKSQWGFSRTRSTQEGFGADRGGTPRSMESEESESRKPACGALLLCSPGWPKPARPETLLTPLTCPERVICQPHWADTISG